MNFTSYMLSKDIDFMQEASMHILKYCNEEIIVTDEKFNILFHNSKCISDNKRYTLFDIMKNFITDDITENIKKFRTSDKNHIFFKLMFNGDYSFKKIPLDIHICKIKNKLNVLKGYTIIIQDI